MTHATDWYVPWNDALIRKYDINAPRYTSYPTALQFSPLQNIEVQNHLDQQRNKQGPLSLYIHIPFCEHLCFYCGCNKIASKDRQRPDHYIDMLEREMVLHARNFGHRPISQLHLGGGTPTFLSLSQMNRLLDMISIYFDWQPSIHQGEFSIELDPRETSKEMLVLLKKRGFNRVSFGIQDFDHRTQVAINRVQPFELVEQKFNDVRELNFDSISVDMICGLPHQSSESFLSTWQKTLALQPDRISLYNYAHLPERFKPQRRINASDLPDADEKLRIMQDSIERLQQAGYIYIGMDHFAKPDDELSKALAQGTLQRNFQGYSTQAEIDMLALGVSGISQIDGAYLQNHHQLDAYEAMLNNMQLAVKRGLFLSRDDKIRQWAILQLACQGRLCLHELSERFQIDAQHYFANAWQKFVALEQDQLVRIDGSSIIVEPLGRLLLRPILLSLDAYYDAKMSQHFSKVM